MALCSVPLQPGLSGNESQLRVSDILLGLGRRSTVRLGVDDGRLVAVKSFTLDYSERSPDLLAQELTDYEELSAYGHPLMPLLVRSTVQEAQVTVIMELVHGVNLQSLMEQHRGALPEPVSRTVFQQLVVCVDFCHRVGKSKRNLKLSKVLIPKDSSIPMLKVCDFHFQRGDSGAALKDPAGQLGSILTSAPELVTSVPGVEVDGRASDVWALGAILCMMLHGQHPFLAAQDVVLPGAEQIKRLIQNSALGQLQLPAAVLASPSPTLDLVTRMLQPDPQQRMTVAQLLAHPWLLSGMPTGLLQLNDMLLARHAAVRTTQQQQQRAGSLDGAPLGGAGQQLLQATAPGAATPAAPTLSAATTWHASVAATPPPRGGATPAHSDNTSLNSSGGAYFSAGSVRPHHPQAAATLLAQQPGAGASILETIRLHSRGGPYSRHSQDGPSGTLPSPRNAGGGGGSTTQRSSTESVCTTGGYGGIGSGTAAGAWGGSEKRPKSCSFDSTRSSCDVASPPLRPTAALGHLQPSPQRPAPGLGAFQLPMSQVLSSGLFAMPPPPPRVPSPMPVGSPYPSAPQPLAPVSPGPGGPSSRPPRLKMDTFSSAAYPAGSASPGLGSLSGANLDLDLTGPCVSAPLVYQAPAHARAQSQLAAAAALTASAAAAAASPPPPSPGSSALIATLLQGQLPRAPPGGASFSTGGGSSTATGSAGGGASAPAGGAPKGLAAQPYLSRQRQARASAPSPSSSAASWQQHVNLSLSQCLSLAHPPLELISGSALVDSTGLLRPRSRGPTAEPQQPTLQQQLPLQQQPQQQQQEGVWQPPLWSLPERVPSVSDLQHAAGAWGSGAGRTGDSPTGDGRGAGRAQRLPGQRPPGGYQEPHAQMQQQEQQLATDQQQQRACNTPSPDVMADMLHQFMDLEPSCSPDPPQPVVEGALTLCRVPRARSSTHHRDALAPPSILASALGLHNGSGSGGGGYPEGCAALPDTHGVPLASGPHMGLPRSRSPGATAAAMFRSCSAAALMPQQQQLQLQQLRWSSFRGGASGGSGAAAAAAADADAMRQALLWGAGRCGSGGGDGPPAKCASQQEQSHVDGSDAQGAPDLAHLWCLPTPTTSGQQRSSSNSQGCGQAEQQQQEASGGGAVASDWGMAVDGAATPCEEYGGGSGGGADAADDDEIDSDDPLLASFFIDDESGRDLCLALLEDCGGANDALPSLSGHCAPAHLSQHQQQHPQQQGHPLQQQQQLLQAQRALLGVQQQQQPRHGGWADGSAGGGGGLARFQVPPVQPHLTAPWHLWQQQQLQVPQQQQQQRLMAQQQQQQLMAQQQHLMAQQQAAAAATTPPQASPRLRGHCSEPHTQYVSQQPCPRTGSDDGRGQALCGEFGRLASSRAAWGGPAMGLAVGGPALRMHSADHAMGGTGGTDGDSLGDLAGSSFSSGGRWGSARSAVSAAWSAHPGRPVPGAMPRRESAVCLLPAVAEQEPAAGTWGDVQHTAL